MIDMSEKKEKTLWIIICALVVLIGGVFTLLFFQCYINSNAIEHLKGKNLNIVSLFQNVLIVIILL